MPTNDDGAVRITLRDVWASLNELKGLVAPLAAANADHSRRLDDHEKRMRAIELRPVITPTAVWTALGVLLTAVAVGVAIIAVVV